MKTKQEIEQLAQEIHYDSAQQGLDANGCFNQYQGFIKGYIQSQEDVDWELLVKLSKRYTEEDMLKAFEKGALYGTTQNGNTHYFNEVINSLNKQN